MTWTKSNTTKHSHPMVFGRKVDGCPRCEELKNGAAPVKWNWNRQDRFDDISKHNCKESGCGPVCTFGEW